MNEGTVMTIKQIEKSIWNDGTAVNAKFSTPKQDDLIVAAVE